MGRLARPVSLLFPALAALLIAGGAGAQQKNIAVEPAASALQSSPTRTWVVLIGINQYRHAQIDKLRYAVNDAVALRRVMLGLGVPESQILLLRDQEATKSRIEEVLGDRLRRAVRAEDRVLVFFSGHGKTVPLKGGEEEGYLVPVDANPEAIVSTGISMSWLRQLADLLPARQILYIVDACYSGYALFKPKGLGGGLVDELMQAPAVQILTAGRKQDQAQERGGHGVFTDVLIRGLEGGAFPVDRDWVALSDVGSWLRDRVYAESGRKQVPQFGNLSGEGQFVFLKPGAAVARVEPPPEPRKPEFRQKIREELGSLSIHSKIPGVEVWLGEAWLGGAKIGETQPGRALVSGTIAVGTYRITARKPGHRDWEQAVTVVAGPPTEVVIDIEPLGAAKVIRGEDGAEMLLVPAGEFWMGSDTGGYDDERPRHRVYLDDYYIDKYEVANALYRRFLEATDRAAPGYWNDWNDARFNGPTQPVVGVTWHDAEAYCKWARKRLPREAEWEKAARGTDGKEYPWGNEWDSLRANSDESKLGKPASVGSYPTGVSPYGVHDMAGNVWEWAADWYDEEYYRRSPERNPHGPDSGERRVLRGGSWYYYAVYLRTAYRYYGTPDYRDYVVGFRCARGRVHEEVRRDLGSLALSARIEGVEVFLGDQPVGEAGPGAAVVLETLAVGTYRVKARKAGHKDWEREVRVAANQRTEVMIDIEPLGPLLVMESERRRLEEERRRAETLSPRAPSSPPLAALRTPPGTEWIVPSEARNLRNPVQGIGNAQQLVEANCVPCHGPRGRGDGPAAPALPTKPSDWTSSTVQQQTDGELFSKISNGRAAMPPWKFLSEKDRWEIVNYLRTLR